MNDLKQIFEDKIRVLNEDDTAGRGRGPLSMFGAKGLRDAIENAMKSARIDYLNLPPKEAQFDTQNFYTLDIRVPTEKAIAVFQNKSLQKTYVMAADAAIKKYIPDNESRVINMIMNAYVSTIDQMEVAARRGKRRADIRKRLQSETSTTPTPNVKESADVFDVLLDVLLCEKSSPEDIELSRKFVGDNNLKIGSKITYKTANGQEIEVEVKALPETGDIPPNTIQVSKPESKSLFAIPVIKNGQPTIAPIVTPEQDAESTGKTSTGQREWDAQYKGKPLTELWNIDELSDIIDDIPPFFVGQEEDMACIPHGATFVSYVQHALESAFRGSVKNGVTIEELLAGKFMNKVITPEKGAFINRIKDPTSLKPINFRAWNDKDLLTLHNIIMETFSRSALLDSIKVDGEKMTPTESQAQKTGGTQQPKQTKEEKTIQRTARGLVLYMTQKDFDKFVRGGQGFKNLAKGAISDVRKALTASTVQV